MNKLNGALVSSNFNLPLIVGLATVSVFSSPVLANGIELTSSQNHGINIEKIAKLAPTFSLSNTSQFSLARNCNLSSLNIDEKLHSEIFSILTSLNQSFSNIETSLEIKNDPEEGFDLIKININSTDEDKINKYFTFIENISLSISAKLSDKIIFDLV